MKKLLLLIIIALLALAGIGWYVFIRGDQTASTKPNTDITIPSNDSSQTTLGFNKSLYSTTDPSSIWVVVNKTLPMPDGYKPTDLIIPETTLRLARTAEQMQMRGEAGKALSMLIAGASDAGYKLAISSAYRSQALQKQFYDSYVKESGAASADTFSARPGYSEHQTGLAADLGRTDQKCQLAVCFGDLPEGKWIAEHAKEYGFIVRYQSGNQAKTGYQYEPWHVRYIGTQLANEIGSTQTLEEFFGLSDAPDYL